MVRIKLHRLYALDLGMSVFMVWFVLTLAPRRVLSLLGLPRAAALSVDSETVQRTHAEL